MHTVIIMIVKIFNVEFSAEISFFPPKSPDEPKKLVLKNDRLHVVLLSMSGFKLAQNY